MKFSPNKRHLILGGLLSLTLVAVAGTHLRSDNSLDLVKPAVKGSSPSAPTANTTQTSVDSLDITGLRQKKPGVDKNTGKTFVGKSWYVPPPPPPAAKALPPPPPTAPPLPFTYVGSIMPPEGGRLRYFVLRNDNLYEIQVGDVLENTYRLEEATEHTLIFIYQPMNVKQTLRIPG